MHKNSLVPITYLMMQFQDDATQEQLKRWGEGRGGLANLKEGLGPREKFSKMSQVESRGWSIKQLPPNCGNSFFFLNKTKIQHLYFLLGSFPDSSVYLLTK